MVAQLRKGKGAHLSSPVIAGKTCAAVLHLHIARDKIRVTAEPVSIIGPVNPWEQFTHNIVVNAEDRIPVKRYVIYICQKRFFQPFKIFIVVKVVRVYVCHDGYAW